MSVGNGMGVAVKAIGTVRLSLGLGNFLDIDNVFYIPSMKRNLISVSRLVKQGCSFLIDLSGIKISHGSPYLGSASLVNDCWMLNCDCPKDVLLIEDTQNSIVKKRKVSEFSAFLWHRRLAHISKARLQRLVKDNLFPSLDFSDFDTCIECVKGKITKTRNKISTRSTEPLQLIHTDICGPFANRTICGNRYFITFIDDFSRYCHLFLISEKSQALEKFVIFRTAVEKELGKEIKAVRSDRGGEYYGRYTEAGQQKGSFALYLEKHGIQSQYTTPGTPESNGVSERRNRTLLNMVRSMMCTSGLPRFLWGEALKTANHISNRTPSKAVEKTPFELWTGRRPSLHHVHVWGCRAEARAYNPQEAKLDSKTISAHFIGYPERSRGYRFYCPSHSTRVIETNKAVFMDEVNFVNAYEDLELEFQELTEIEAIEPAATFDFDINELPTSVTADPIFTPQIAPQSDAF